MRSLLILLFIGLSFSLLQAQAGKDKRKKVKKKKVETKKTAKPATPKENTPKVDKNASYTITGVIKDEDNEPMEGAIITVKDLVIGTMSDDEGKFSITITGIPNATIYIAYIGYERIEKQVSAGTVALQLKMEVEAIQADEVLITASRVQERSFTSPVQSIKIDQLALRETAALNAYELPNVMAGVDLISPSLGLKVLNARGFASTNNARFVQILDGMDLQAPGLNVYGGLLNGVVDLDIATAELVAGPSSALYGPNAFNGIYIINTKSPFEYPGLSVSMKTGVNHLDGIDTDPSPLADVSVRYAMSFKDKFAFKVNVSILDGTDFYATSDDDVADYSHSTITTPGRGNPGFNGLNYYGDEASTTLDASSSPNFGTGPLIAAPTTIARTGYIEQDIVKPVIKSYRASATLHYRPTNKLEIISSTRYNTGNAMYQGNQRFNLVKFLSAYQKFEVRTSNFTARAYISQQNAGKTFDASNTGINILNKSKAHEDWFAQYMLAYSDDPTAAALLQGAYALSGLTAPTGLNTKNDAAARAFADGNNNNLFTGLSSAFYPGIEAQYLAAGVPAATAAQLALQDAQAAATPFTQGLAMPKAGSAEFDALHKEISNSSIKNFNNGAMYEDNSRFYHADLQYNLADKVKFADILVGGNGRLFSAYSNGAIFVDTLGKRLNIPEIGVYAQATKKVMEDKLKFIGALRYDRNFNFKGQITPRLATTYSAGKKQNHVFRAVYQTGFRMPVLLDQYFNIDVGTIHLLGALSDVKEPFGVRNNNAYTVKSLYDYAAARTAGTSQEDAAKSLSKWNTENIKPEKIGTYELGYRTSISSKLKVDVTAYYNAYKNFIGYIDVISASSKDVGTANETLDYNDIDTGNYKVFRFADNSDEIVNSWGGSLSLGYNITKKLNVFGNYSYNDYDETKNNQDGLLAGINTTPHKINLGLTGRKIKEKFGFNAILHYVAEFEYSSPFGAGTVPSYTTMDMQVSYSVPKIHSIFKLGGTNVLNNRHIEAYGSPTIGSLYYFQIVYDGFIL